MLISKAKPLIFKLTLLKYKMTMLISKATSVIFKLTLLKYKMTERTFNLTLRISKPTSR